ncbi:hypothetical protein JMUB3935_1736 [Leptotrichia trevisanii]|uniref:Uncharacterized protein n=1 Tax=Leptotrichia trevisanii TaxID=109328 RepID=A0A510KM57_9FUSO|nr:hypothetical protein [Leptotrichia trevisanii]BBM52756.1 hypothetical protein JMUB3935_1736 [Leptotrichia trevisanii]
MGKEKTQFEKVQDKVQQTIFVVNEKIRVLGTHLETLNIALMDIQEKFDMIQNIPNEEKIRYEELKQIRLNWKKQVDEITKKYEEIKKEGSNVAGGVAGVGAGVAVATLGPGVAMGIATVFGVASTGTAVSALSGAAAANAALAWLGGGALAAGGGGMAAGETFLALMGPIGLAIAGFGIIAGGFLFWKNKNDKKCLEDLLIRISNRDLKSFELAIDDLNHRIKQIDNGNVELKVAIRVIPNLGLDYNKMTEQQQQELKKYIHLIALCTQLLVDPIKELQPKYTEEDFDKYIKHTPKKYREWHISSQNINISSFESFGRKMAQMFKEYKKLNVTLANFLYKININEAEKKLLWKSFRNNEEFLKSMNVNKKNFNIDIFDTVLEALNFKYRNTR